MSFQSPTSGEPGSPADAAKRDIGLVRAVLLNDTRVDRHHGCAIVGRTIAELAVKNGIEIIAASPAHHDWRSDARVLNAISDAGLVIVNGEGTIHHDRPAGRWLLEAGQRARQAGKKAALINTTWQANGREAAAFLKSFDLVAVREQASASEMAALGVPCLTVPDLALLHEWPAAESRKGVGFSDCVVPRTAVELERIRRRMGGIPLNILYGRTGLMDTLQAVRRQAGGLAASPLRLLEASRTVTVERRAATSSTEGFMRRLTGCRLLVTGRFHAMILALATRTPVLAVASNTHKIEATMKDAGLDAFRIVQPEDIDAALIAKASRWSDTESAALESFLAQGRAGISDLFVRLRGLVT